MSHQSEEKASTVPATVDGNGDNALSPERIATKNNSPKATLSVKTIGEPPLSPITEVSSVISDCEQGSQATQAHSDKKDVVVKEDDDDLDLSIVSADVGADDLKDTTLTTVDTETNEKLPVIKYHIDADLYIKLTNKDGPILYKVWSPVVAAASPVWRKIIYGGSYPHFQNGKWVIEMLDDDVFGLDVIMSIAHWKFHELPERPNVDELYGLAKMISKYDCSQLIVPYMQVWVGSLNWHVAMNDNSSKNDDEKTLYLTWILGEGRWFSRVVSRVAYKATINDDGELVDSKGNLWKDQDLPDYVIGLIASARLEAVTQILYALSVPFSELMDATKNQEVKFCRSTDGSIDIKHQCQFQQLGSLMSGLMSADLMPVPSAESYKGSVHDLANKVNKIKVTRFKVPGVVPHQDTHSGCGIGHKEAVVDAMPSMVQLKGELIQELKGRAKRSGAYNSDLFRELNEMEEREPSPVPEVNLREDPQHYKQFEDFDATDPFEHFDVEIKVEDVDA
ncbi:hypothetical protein OQA88_8202 [Cercophora sp. LCS_1]